MVRDDQADHSAYSRGGADISQPSAPKFTTPQFQIVECACHDDATQAQAQHRVGALMAHHHLVWMSHHLSGSRQDIHGTLGPLRREAVGGSTAQHGDTTQRMPVPLWYPRMVAGQMGQTSPTHDHSAQPLQLHATYDVHTDPEKIEAQIVDVPVPGIMEEILEVIQLVPQERIQERIVEEIIDVLVAEVMEKTVEVGKHIRQEGMQSWAVEQTVGVPFPLTQKEIREVT